CLAVALTTPFLRPRKVALGVLHVPDYDQRLRMTALPARIAGIGFRQPLIDGEAVAVRCERARKVALCLLHTADLPVAHRRTELPARITGIRFRHPIRDGSAVAA